MKAVVLGFILIFGSIGATFAWLGNGENRSLGFTNICGDRGVVCLRKVVEKKEVAPEFAAGAKHYTQCAACHGQAGEGGMGPQLSGQTSDMIVQKLTKYKNKVTIGAMSNIMWGQASWMTNKDMRDIGNYLETL